jgi:hypothetical protein
MKPRPLASEPLRISGHQALTAADVPIGDLADDLNGLVYSQIDRLQDSASFPAVHMWRQGWRMLLISIR